MFAKPKMTRYIEYSKTIYQIYLKYIDYHDVHVYSIDEAFLDFTDYSIYDHLSPIDLAQKILNEIYVKTKVTAMCGIGENMFLAKIALDNFAKKSANNIAFLDKNRFFQLVWPLKVTNMWGIGKNIEKRLNKMGLYTFADIANANCSSLEAEFGIIGIEIYEHAWGIDESIVSKIKNYSSLKKTIGYGQVLFSDYTKDDLIVVLHEMVEEISYRLVRKNLECQEISLTIAYSKYESNNGFTKTRKLENSTDNFKILAQQFKLLYEENIENLKIRKIRIRVGRLIQNNHHQFNLFEDRFLIEKERNLCQTIINIKDKYGKNAIFRASSLTNKATMLKRNNLIGGHNAK